MLTDFYGIVQLRSQFYYIISCVIVSASMVTF